MPQLAPKISELVKVMNNIALRQFSEDADSVNDMEVMRLKNEAKKLPAAADKEELLGMISTVEMKCSEADRHFDLAISYNSSNAEVIVNHAIAMDHMGRYDEAKEKAIHAYNYAEGNKRIVDLIISLSIKAGDLRTATQWIEVWKKITGGEIHPDSKYITDASRLLDEQGVSSSDFQKLVHIATNITLDKRYPISNDSISVSESDGQRWLSYQINVHRPFDEVEEINEILIDQLIEIYGSSPLEAIVLNYQSRY